MGRIYCEACGANWRSSGDGPEAQEHHVDVPCVGESTEFKQRAEIAALTEKLRAVEAERDDVCLMLVRSTSTKSTLTSIAIENLQHIARLERGEAEREAHLEAGARELSALRAEIERKDAALRRIAEGNLGDKPWQGDYGAIRTIAVAALENLRSENDGR